MESFGFKLLRNQRIETLNVNILEYQHGKTGAMHYHLQAPYKENVFLVALRTHPMNSTGVAHILEHTTLCGSENFPVRDPFFLMIRRSLNTFMNAFTSSDYTAYPFASQNRKDFFNLLDIYLDAVFASRLDPLDFAQEGHRMEFEDAGNMESDLVYKGVVYNEMKGDTSSPVSCLYDVVKKHLFPTTTYHYNSGGDPAEIPQLTYQELLSFYKTHYHPGNAIFMTFGDIDVAELQQVIEEKALSRFDSSPVKLAVKEEQRYSEPLSVTELYSLDDSEDIEQKSHVVLAWLLGRNTNLKELMRCHLVSDILLETSASPLRFALESSGLGSAASPLCGLEDSNHEMSFMCGLEGCRAEDADKVEAVIMNTLVKIAEQGVKQERLEAVLHQLELHQREIGGDGYPYGLQLMFSCMSAAIHRGDPVKLMDLDPVIEELREEIKQAGYLQQLVNELLINNTHRVRVVLKPDPGLSALKIQNEKEHLEKVKSKLTAQDKMDLIEQTRNLEIRQQTEDDVDLLPKVGIEDIPTDAPDPVNETLQLLNQDRLTTYRAGTNGLVYQQSVISLPPIEAELMHLLPLYAGMLGEIGCAGRTYLDTQNLQQSTCGGINVSPSIRWNVDGQNAYSAFLTVSTRALTYKFEEASELLYETLHAPRFDEFPRIAELIKQTRVRREAAIVRNGHVLAMLAASSAYSQVSRLNNELTGLAAMDRLKRLDASLSEEKYQTKLTTQMNQLHKAIVDSEKQHLLVCDEEFQASAISILDGIQSRSGHCSANPFDISFQNQSVREAWITTTQVNFCASAFPTVSENHQDSPALSVLSGVLRNGYLHKVVREQGGAYGGGASHDSSNGVFRFYSYRDPNLLDTLKAFKASVDWVLSAKLEFSQVEESILGIISSLDSPSSPAGEAKQSFHQVLHGRTFEQRKHYRDSIIGVTAADVQAVAEKYLGNTEDSSQVVITNQSGASKLESFSFEARNV